MNLPTAFTECRPALSNLKVSPALMSVRQDVALRARIALEKLRELREQKETELTTTLPVTLVVRDSTGFV